MTRFVNGNILRERGATGVLGEASFQRNQAPQRSLEAASASVLVTATQNARSMRGMMGCGTKNFKDNRCAYLAMSGIRVDAVLSDGKFSETL